nr:hypothetical protein [Tanacetum cinerariifolium]
MLVAQEVGEDADEVHVKDVNAAGVSTEGVVSAADDVVSTAVVEPSMPSPTPPTPPPQPTQDQPLTSQVHLTLPPSPQVQPQSPQHQSQPSQDARISMDLLQNLMDTYDTVMDDVSKQGGIIENINADEDVVLEDAKDVADVEEIFEKHFDSNVAFLQKTKEQMDEEDNRALKRMNESQEDNALKKQKLNEEVEELKIYLQIVPIDEDDVYTKAIPLALKKLDEEVEELKRHLQIVPNDEDDVYTEDTPLALKVPVIDYEIYNENNKPYYKIKRADGSHQLYMSFLSLLRNFDREDLEAL